MASAETFLAVAKGITGRARGLHVISESERKFRALFGTSPVVIANAWNRLATSIPQGGSYKHILWAFLLLKVYGNQIALAESVSTNRQTWRKWSWEFVQILSNLKVIDWNSRLTQSIQVDNGAFRCHASVDCTDIPICEPSHKFKSAGLRYEVSISLDGHIVLCNGPYPAGIRNDLQIYRDTLRQKLSHREVIVGDSAYLDPTCVYDDEIDDGVAQSLRNRQETVFSRMNRLSIRI